MISPHPSTAQKVAEEARRERLMRLAETRRYPVTSDVTRARFNAGTIAHWLRLKFRAHRSMMPEIGRRAVKRMTGAVTGQ